MGYCPWNRCDKINPFFNGKYFTLVKRDDNLIPMALYFSYGAWRKEMRMDDVMYWMDVPAVEEQNTIIIAIKEYIRKDQYAASLEKKLLEYKDHGSRNFEV